MEYRVGPGYYKYKEIQHQPYFLNHTAIGAPMAAEME